MKIFATLFAVTLLTLACLAATAQAAPAIDPTPDSTPEPLPDKTTYTLFNPVPDDLLRDFSSDRPTKGSTPYTVDAGHFQYEADIAAWSYDRYNAARITTSNVTLFDAVMKLGLTQNTELELGLAPLNLAHTQDYGAGGKSAAFGFGDVTARLKYNIFGNDAGDNVVAIVPYVKVPTAEHDIGNGYWESGVYLPVSIGLPNDWSIGALTELDIEKNANLNGVHTNYQNLINLNHPLFSKTITGSVEFWSDVNNDHGVATQYTGDLSLAWLATKNLQFDGGVNVGLNKAAPDMQIYAGISQRF